MMRQWAQDPVVTAECVRLQQDLDAERRIYEALDVTAQALDRTAQHQAGMWYTIYNMHLMTGCLVDIPKL